MWVLSGYYPDRVYLRASYWLVTRLMDRRMDEPRFDVPSAILRDLQRFGSREPPLTQLGQIAWVHALHEAGMSP